MRVRFFAIKRQGDVKMKIITTTKMHLMCCFEVTLPRMTGIC